ncbi:adhesion G-protein coupled receptor G4-like isoform X2 [Dunckerocampus dactyliophorus]|uniref:adhesion G-protein coupled receptor G4-like isoform X2 n=1 Tax=Dunckerocampus dactyliophorus TaxID=161453 RepID=UPI0024053E12|nr:adhesion G-protein coupled receptor G4-like isoform X2 [Dunckerocampus dactyliophorus]
MIFHPKILFVALLCSAVSTTMRAPPLSLWGKVAEFNVGCSHWRLEDGVSFPTLNQLTACLDLKFKAPASAQWTAFMYRLPDTQCVGLGLGGRRDRLVVWLFGTEWTTLPISLALKEWHSLCMTWSHTKDGPMLYVNGTGMDLMAVQDSSPSCCKLAPNGTLTLGAAHKLVDGNVQILLSTILMGTVSLFRLWAQERSRQEVTSLKCTEGDLLRWDSHLWDTRVCAPIPDPTLKCEWSIYTVNLKFNIIRYDGNNTELYTARDVAHRWLRDVLPSSIYLHRVSVFEAARSSAKDANTLATLSEDKPVRATSSSINRFDCLVYVSVIPCVDVAAVQDTMHANLGAPYHGFGSLIQVLADVASIQTTPVASFSPPVTTRSPPVTTFTLTTSALTSTYTETSPNISGQLYFEVKVNVSIRGECEAEHLLATWLNNTLPDHTMTVLDLQLLPKHHRLKRSSGSDLSIWDGVSSNIASRERFIFQVEVKMLPTHSQEAEDQIRDLLLSPYNQGSVSIEPEDVQICRILIVTCQSESQQTRRGLFEWPVTPGGKNASQPCPKNPQRHATRHCKLSLSTQWMAPDLQECPLVVETIPDLDIVEVTPDNAMDVVEMMQGLLKNHSKLSYRELDTVLNKLKDVVDVSVVTPILGTAVINTISDILESPSFLIPFTNTILNITEAVGDRMVVLENSSSLVAPAVVVSMVDVVPGEFAGLTFGVSSDGMGSKPEIFLNRFPLKDTVAFIALPSILQHSFPPNQSPPRVQFQFYGIPQLFRDNHKKQILNSLVVSASVSNTTSQIQDLQVDIQITLRHLQPSYPHMDTQCVYWNFNKNNGRGGWDPRGCRKHNSSLDFTTCLCDHLTHFGVLLDVSRTPVDKANEHILTIITYGGCGVSSLFLGITVLTYTAFHKLRQDYPSKILINLSLALLGLNLAFLLDSWLSSWGMDGLCVAAAAALHYFLLASFTWMGLEGVNMYFALVKVFNVYVPAYMLKFCALGWGIPLIICVLVLIVNREAYGHLYNDVHTRMEPIANSDSFCWFQDDITFYVSVVAYALLVFLFNIAVFVVVLIQIRHMRATSPSGTRGGLMHDLKGIVTLTLLLGLTWTVGFFTWGPARLVLLYMFSVLNAMQGMFIFLFHCLMKENVRRQWRIHLCFGKFLLEEHSEWSHSASVAKPAQRVPSVRSVKSSSTDSTSASYESSQRGWSCKRPDLGLFINPLTFPRAQTSYPGVGAVPNPTTRVTKPAHPAVGTGQHGH